MRSVTVAILALIPILPVLGGCASQRRSDGTGASGAGSPAGAAGTHAGAAGTFGTSGTGGGGSGSAGTSVSGAAGTTTAGVDNGRLFGDAAVVTLGQDPAPAADADVAPPPSATGTLRINGLGLTALFTQKGADVTMVATATGCAQGSHVLQIHAGFSCDTAGTQGGVWDGKRGDGIPPLVCGADRKGSLTYTRSGADPALAWTVGDHSTKTDVTLHPVMAEGNCGTFL